MCCYAYVCVCSSDYAGERIPTLFEAVELCKRLDLLMLLELKENPAKVTDMVTDDIYQGELELKENP